MNSNELFCYVGNWGFVPKPKGISIFSYDVGKGSLCLKETIRQDIAAGQLCIDEKHDVLFASDECGERKGEIGGGGYVYSFRINHEDGSLNLINRVDSLSPEPSYLCQTKDKKFLIVCHCSDPWHVTKIVRHEDGSIGNEVLFDDTALVLFPVHEDGSIGAACDTLITEGSGGKGPNAQRNVDPVTHHIQLIEVISRLHSVVPSPDGRIFIAMDKGMDRIISLRVDEEKQKLQQLDEYKVEEVGSFPRYGVFHPTLPVFYSNNENKALLNCFTYDENGKLGLLAKGKLLSKDPGLIDGKPAGCQDIVINAEGSRLYVSLSGVNQISVVSIDADGKPELIQEISSNGIFPRCIHISPDGRFLLAGNMESGDISTYKILEDGKLEYTGNTYKAVSPSAIRFADK